uniref:FlgD Ig-like domain-containing protein n=1 Tax=candidate division WOR-3 bacterium TaxID=2052148 RepID=A0A7V3RIU2_UNCW3
MIHLLTFLLIGQLDHFGFDNITSPKTAGVYFQITVYALNSAGQPVPYNGSARIYIPNISYPGVSPDTTVYFNGNSSWQGNIMVSIAGDNITLKCEGEGKVGTSNPFQVIPNSPYRLLAILPGQNYAPGSQSGRTGTPSSQQAGSFFDFTIYLTDRWSNRITSTDDSVLCSSSDGFSPIKGLRLNNGIANINYAFRTATTQKFFIHDVTNSSIKPDTSSNLYVYPGPYNRLLVLLPGENHLPGDTTSNTAYTPGKSGIPSEQYVLEDFNIMVYATDSMWNKTGVSGYSIGLSGSSGFSNPSPQNLQNGVAQFTANFSTSGEKFLIARDLNNNFISYDNFLRVVARASNFDIVVNPDTISPGEIAHLNVTVYDRNNDPIGGKWVNFSVVGGHGYIIPQYDTVQTNNQGFCQSQFTITSGYFNELDSIEIKADNYAETTTVYVIIPDSSVMEGNIVAYPNPFGKINQPYTRFVYFLQQNCNIIFSIYDAFGNCVHHEEIPAGQNGARMGINHLIWDGKNDKGHKVASGVYYVLIKGYFHTNVFLEKRIMVGVIW